MGFTVQMTGGLVSAYCIQLSLFANAGSKVDEFDIKLTDLYLVGSRSFDRPISVGDVTFSWLSSTHQKHFLCVPET